MSHLKRKILLTVWNMTETTTRDSRRRAITGIRGDRKKERTWDMGSQNRMNSDYATGGVERKNHRASTECHRNEKNEHGERKH